MTALSGTIEKTIGQRAHTAWLRMMSARAIPDSPRKHVVSAMYRMFFTLYFPPTVTSLV
jgi:hypothetical protein